MTDDLTFGWVSPVIGTPESNHEPIVMFQEREILPTAFEHFDRHQTYVLCCEFGLMSSQLADRMRRAGFRAHHFRGGQRALMRVASGV